MSVPKQRKSSLSKLRVELSSWPSLGSWVPGFREEQCVHSFLAELEREREHKGITILPNFLPLSLFIQLLNGFARVWNKYFPS